MLKSGLHFPYNDHFPKERKKKFKGVSEGELLDIYSKEQFVGDYIKAINYTVDPFFKILFTGGFPSEAVVLYTSDHGQNLMDDGKRVTHCRSENANIQESLVPLFVYCENDSLNILFEKACRKNKNKLSHYEIPSTLLVLMGFKEMPVYQKHGQSIFQEVNHPQKFITGGIEMFYLGLRSKTYISWKQAPENLDLSTINLNNYR